MEVKLKRNGWHKRLQVWTFGSKAPAFNSLCPFFWTTVFCVLVSPLVASFKYLIKLPIHYLVLALDATLMRVADLIEALTQYLDVEVCQPMYEQKITNYVDNMSDEDALDIYSTLYKITNYKGVVSISDDAYLRDKWYDSKTKAYKAYVEKLERWKKKVGDAWQSRLQTLAEEREARRKEQERLLAKWEAEQEAKKERLKKVFNAIAYYTKYLLYLVMGVVGVYVLYFVALLGLWIYEARADIYSGLASFATFLLKAVVVGGPYVLGAIAGLAVLIPVVMLAVKLLAKCNLFQVSRSTKPSKLYLMVKKVADGIGSVFEFFVMYAKAAKQNYCPHIDWEE